MGTLQLVQDGGNGNGGNGANGKAPLGCPHGKKSFPSTEEAERFEADNQRLYPKREKQYAYKCDDCPDYHLSSKSPEAYAMGQSNLKRLEALATEKSVAASAKPRPRGETEALVRRLWEEGKSDSEIASEIGMTYPAASYHRKKFGSPNGKAQHNSPRRLAKPPMTLNEFDERKRLLEEEHRAELQALERQRLQLVEAVSLTIKECQDGKALFIKFGHHERMVLPKDKVTELANSLMQWI